MKKAIATLLIPITVLIIFFKKIIEISLDMGQLVAEGVISIIENNYNFWKQIFKWKDGE